MILIKQVMVLQVRENQPVGTKRNAVISQKFARCALDKKIRRRMKQNNKSFSSLQLIWGFPFLFRRIRE